ncbi:MAG: hypothetical protein ACOC7U_00995 [Spirochaetota bacterium]
MSYRDLKEILNISINWERKLKDFYDVAEVALRDDRSEKVVAILRRKLVQNLKILEGIHPQDYGKVEWVKFPLEYHEKELIPIQRIRRDSSPGEIFEQILEYEIKMRDFYSDISKNIAPGEQKDLFDSLVSFKIRQIIELKKYMEDYDLAI